jgi:hypothetical protein
LLELTCRCELVRRHDQNALKATLQSKKFGKIQEFTTETYPHLLIPIDWNDQLTNNNAARTNEYRHMSIPLKQ